jgi:hypothetical protein
MPTDMRTRRLQSTGKLFGVEGKLALVEYYASLPDPADFTWGAAVEHIAYRLQLLGAGLSHLAVAILQRSAPRGG